MQNEPSHKIAIMSLPAMKLTWMHHMKLKIQLRFLKYYLGNIVCLNSNVTKVYPKKLLIKSSQNYLIFFTCILHEYVSPDSPKNFEKISIFENMTAVLSS